MPATIKTYCHDGCGSVEVSGLHVTLAIWPNKPGLSTYSFVCPRCHHIQVLPAGPVVQSLLVQGGVLARVMRLPEHDTPKDVAPLTYDDLLELLLESEGTDTLTELLEEGMEDDTAEEG